MFVDFDSMGNGNPSYLTPVGSALFFSATESTHGTELWKVSDFSPPQTKITKHPKKTVYTKKRSATVRFRFSSDESGSTFTCKLDSGKWKPCNSPKSVKVKASKGKHTFRVRATDKAGNADGTPAKWVWRVKRK